jgi:hypothetical protein
MSHPVRSLAALAAGLVLAVSAPAAHAQVLADSAGTYRFEARSGTTMLLEGTMTITPDTVIVEAHPGPCFPTVGGSKSGSYVIKCAHVTMRVDRTRPLTRTQVTGTRVVIDRKEVCTLEGRDNQGRTICLKWGYESTERDAPVTARIRIIRS